MERLHTWGPGPNSSLQWLYPVRCEYIMLKLDQRGQEQEASGG